METRITITTAPPEPRLVELPDGTRVRYLPESEASVGTSDVLRWPAGFWVHRLVLHHRSREVPITIVPHIVATRTDLPGWTVNPSTPLPTEIDYHLGRPVALEVVLRVEGPDAEPVTIVLSYEPQAMVVES